MLRSHPTTGLCSHGLHSYGLYSYGLCSHGSRPSDNPLGRVKKGGIPLGIEAERAFFSFFFQTLSAHANGRTHAPREACPFAPETFAALPSPSNPS